MSERLKKVLWPVAYCGADAKAREGGGRTPIEMGASREIAEMLRAAGGRHTGRD
jgi:hypothetical protein